MGEAVCELYEILKKKEQKDHYTVDFLKLQLGDAAEVWNSEPSMIYMSWKAFKKASLKKFYGKKNRPKARKHIANMEIYRGKIIFNYGKLKRMFEIAGIRDEEEQ
ncbi:hypothetical protein AYI70_g4503 [Smittium culicis]|uniref:Retrotransposon gag domain-containing protein n=1 Tax=Smittium culicis TaxID=133412 RepID=A0A1R1XYN8_9FUNG|nr:hypothetical protein AYI70_g4503 [Smittium culicis]